MTPDLVTFIIVPNQSSQVFGSLYEIKSESDEIFISGATVDNIEVIDAVTASRLRADGTVVTASTRVSAGIQSSTTTSANTTGVATSNTTSSGASSLAQQQDQQEQLEVTMVQVLPKKFTQNYSSSTPESLNYSETKVIAGGY